MAGLKFLRLLRLLDDILADAWASALQDEYQNFSQN
jgi:hypothetical protein